MTLLPEIQVGKTRILCFFTGAARREKSLPFPPFSPPRPTPGHPRQGSLPDQLRQRQKVLLGNGSLVN